MHWSALPGLRRWNRGEKTGPRPRPVIACRGRGGGGRLAATGWHGRPISSL